MTPDQLNEVWAMLDLEHLASMARKGPELYSKKRGPPPASGTAFHGPVLFTRHRRTIRLTTELHPDELNIPLFMQFAVT